MADNTSTSYQDLGYDRIFVSLDGSEEQAKVLDRAITIAACDNAEPLRWPRHRLNGARGRRDLPSGPHPRFGEGVQGLDSRAGG